MYRMLEEDYTALMDSSNEIYQAHLAQLEQIRQKKLDAVDKWAENELKAADKYYQGQVYAIENDYAEKSTRAIDRLNDFLAFKLQLLREKFPDAAEYFQSQGYQWPIQENIQAPTVHMTPDVEIEISEQPLLSNNEVQEDMTVISSIVDGRINQSALLNGLQVGSEAMLCLPQLPPFRGTITSISDDHFEFTRTSGKTLTVLFSALELKHAIVSAIQ